MPTYTKADMQYKRIYNVWVKDAGVWKLLDKAFVKLDGWKEIHKATRVFVFTRTISSTVYNFNLYSEMLAAGWDGYSPIQATVTITASGIVASTSPTLYAFTSGSLYPEGSIVSITNRGIIVGRGGAGGEGGGITVNAGTAGTNGGPALFCGYPCTIDNQGTIAGGGGGGGGGANADGFGSGAGGGGGGGAGFGTRGPQYSTSGDSASGAALVGGVGGIGDSSSGSVPFEYSQSGGNGGAGGAPASAGAPGTNGYFEDVTSGPGTTYPAAANNTAGGAAISGNSNISWVTTGTRIGAVL